MHIKATKNQSVHLYIKSLSFKLFFRTADTVQTSRVRSYDRSQALSRGWHSRIVHHQRKKKGNRAAFVPNPQRSGGHPPRRHVLLSGCIKYPVFFELSTAVCPHPSHRPRNQPGSSARTVDISTCPRHSYLSDTIHLFQHAANILQTCCCIGINDFLAEFWQIRHLNANLL